MVRNPTYSPQAQKYPDPIRIAGIAAAITANVALFMVLMEPMNFPVQTQPEDPRWIEHAKAVKIDPVTKPVDQTKHKVEPVHVTQPHVVLKKVDPTPVVSKDTPPITVPYQAPSDIGLVSHDDPPVLRTIETSLRPIASPAPDYPISALRDSIAGKVELELLVGVDGRVLEVTIVHGSGNRELDNAARDQVLRNWRFEPAMENGVPVQAKGRLPIVFTLNGQ